MNKKNYLFKKIKWVWIDHFTKFPLEKKFFDFLKKKKVKIYIVSPELVNYKLKNKIKYLKKYLKRNNFKIDAVCTKFPKRWDN